MRRLTSIWLALALVAGLVASTGLAGAALAPMCDADFVLVGGRTVTVLPTGVDDTANIKCAFETASTLRSRAIVQLAEGTYHTGQLVVDDFHGTFRGKGTEQTVVQALPDLVVTAGMEDVIFYPPTNDPSWPSLLVFVGGNFSMEEMSVKVVGEQPTTGWFVFEDLWITDLAHLILVVGDEAHSRFNRIALEGEAAPNSLVGYNVINGLWSQGLLGGFGPLTGSTAVTNSTFEAVGFSIPISNVDHFSALVSHNRVSDVIVGIEAADVRHADFDIVHNNVEAFIGFDVYDADFPFRDEFPIGTEDSSFLVKDNVFSGDLGVVFESTFGGDMRCEIIRNDVAANAIAGILLGEATYGCKVIAHPDDVVLDFGTDNIIIGPRGEALNSMDALRLDRVHDLASRR